MSVSYKKQEASFLEMCARCGSRQRGVCSVLAEDELRSLSRNTSEIRLQSGEENFLSGDQEDDIVIVKEGAVAVYRLMEDGRRSIARFLFEGDVLGIGQEGETSQTIRALSETVVCRITRSRFVEAMQSSSDMSLKVVAMLSEELKTAQDQLMSLGRKTAPERLAGFFVWLSSRSSSYVRGNMVIHLLMSRSDIADYLGLTIETVSRTLAKFRKEHIIELQDIQNVRILDQRALRFIAGIDDDAEHDFPFKLNQKLCSGM